MADNHELRISHHSGETTTYTYPTFMDALQHAIDVASRDQVERIEIWHIVNKREFAYNPAANRME